MEETIIHENKTFSNVNYAEKKLRDREFINCKFIACDFSKSDLRGNSFEDCQFQQCNFSMAIIEGAGFRNAVFSNCKLLGLDFTRCNKFVFSFRFIESILDYSTFYGTKLKKTEFKNCMLKDVDFSESDLSSSIFSNCDLTSARFSNTILEKTDFRTAVNFAIDPEGNILKKAKFSALNLSGLLYKYDLDISNNE